MKDNYNMTREQYEKILELAYNRTPPVVREAFRQLIDEHFSMTEWISVKDQLPDEDMVCLITDGEEVAVGQYRDDADAWEHINFGWLERERDDECPCRMGKIIAWTLLHREEE